MVTLCLQPLTFKLVLIMKKVEKIHYVDKAKVLNILQDADEKYKEQIEQLLTFTLPARDGEWIPYIDTDGNVLYQCSICGYHNITQPYFCERCGARMNKNQV